MAWGTSSLDSYNVAQDQANAANEARYQQILAGYQNMIGENTAREQEISGSMENRYQRLMGQARGYGDSKRLQLEDDYSRAQGQLMQSLNSRGLSNSTV